MIVKLNNTSVQKLKTELLKYRNIANVVQLPIFRQQVSPAVPDLKKISLRRNGQT